ncbi:hypothetical protein DPEC_G00152240 [Dallia pectoralis]|uniref:Uncharacterized protein n=1 Tax=Dallia pectoralis TaxID=75939 RepID=A0ACC2GJU2_DALPE|nr:hypothetical protein DPEC_G00152240 [Dallia pectoralis]
MNMDFPTSGRSGVPFSGAIRVSPPGIPSGRAAVYSASPLDPSRRPSASMLQVLGERRHIKAPRVPLMKRNVVVAAPLSLNPAPLPDPVHKSSISPTLEHYAAETSTRPIPYPPPRTPPLQILLIQAAALFFWG